jgi:hypothetical protein
MVSPKRRWEGGAKAIALQRSLTMTAQVAELFPAPREGAGGLNA